jgi:hypothetical protein
MLVLYRAIVYVRRPPNGLDDDSQIAGSDGGIVDAKMNGFVLDGQGVNLVSASQKDQHGHPGSWPPCSAPPTRSAKINMAKMAISDIGHLGHLGLALASRTP